LLLRAVVDGAVDLRVGDEPAARPALIPEVHGTLMCARRSEVPCETAQIATLPSWVGTTEKFSAARQKLTRAMVPLSASSERRR